MAEALHRSADAQDSGSVAPPAVSSESAAGRQHFSASADSARSAGVAATSFGRAQRYSLFENEDDLEAVEPDPSRAASPRGNRPTEKLETSFEQKHDWRAFFAFAIFGAGSAWVVVNGAFLQLPVYQHKFGLAAANRMEIGYNMGTFAVPCFAVARALLRARGRRIYYKAIISVIAVINLSSIIVAARGIETLDELVLLNVVGGGCGYLAGFVHQAYILLRYESRYVAAFWTGDAAAGALAAVLAMFQRPDLGEDSTFSSRAFYILLAPLIPLSVVMLFQIERLRLGILPDADSMRALDGADDDELDANESCEAPCPDLAGSIEMTDGKSSDVSPTKSAVPDPANPDAYPTGIAEPDPASPGAYPTGLAKPNNFRRRRTGTVGHLAKKASKKVMKSAGIALAPMRTRPKDSVVLSLVVFWSQFANWGVGDSIYPFACDKAAEGRAAVQGETCVLNASIGTVFAELVGSYLAATCVRQPSLATLRCPAFMYTTIFVLLCAAAAVGGFWASPFGMGGWYIVVLVTSMRVSGPFMRNVVNILIQTRYEPLVWDDVNFILLCLGTLSNVVGLLAGLAFVES